MPTFSSRFEEFRTRIAAEREANLQAARAEAEAANDVELTPEELTAGIVSVTQTVTAEDTGDGSGIVREENQTSSFTDQVAALQAEQDARAQQIADAGSSETLVIRTGDDVTGGANFGGDIVTITQNGGKIVVTGDVPENANLEINAGGEPIITSASLTITGEDIGDGSGVSPDNDTPSQVITEGTVIEIEAPREPEAQITPAPAPADTGNVFEGGAGTDILTGEDDANDTLIGNAGDDRLAGRSGDDVLDGGAGNDRLFGGNGNDTLEGGAGRDLIWGGSGDDTFIFNEGDGRDSIRDFDRSGDDTILLNVDGIDSFDQLLETVSRSSSFSTEFDFGGGDRLSVLESLDSLTADDFIFA